MASKIVRSGPASKTVSPVFLRMTPDQRKRLKLAAVERDLSYADLIMTLLDEHDARMEKARRFQKSPLHRPAVPDLDISGGGGV